MFEGVFAGEEDFSARADYTLPGNRATAAVQGPCDLAGVAGVSGGVGDVAVGGDFAFRDATDLGEKELEEIFGRHGNRVEERREDVTWIDGAQACCLPTLPSGRVGSPTAWNRSRLLQ